MRTYSAITTVVISSFIGVSIFFYEYEFVDMVVGVYIYILFCGTCDCIFEKECEISVKLRIKK